MSAFAVFRPPARPPSLRPFDLRSGCSASWAISTNRGSHFPSGTPGRSREWDRSPCAL